MSLRWRKTGELLCAAKHPAEPGDTYIDDRLHEKLVFGYYIFPDDDEATNGKWEWSETDYQIAATVVKQLRADLVRLTTDLAAARARHRACLARIQARDRLIGELLTLEPNPPRGGTVEKVRAAWAALQAGTGTGETESDPCPCDRCPGGEPCGISGQEDCHQREEWDVREMQRQIRTGTGPGKPEPGEGEAGMKG